MGYTHGKKWNDSKIRESILTVKDWLGIDRMPTKKECDEYYGSYALSNAISRRGGGWYSLAKSMNLDIKASETTLGKSRESNVKKILLKKGFDVEQMSQNFPYDLLVDKCVKLDVKASHLYKGTNGNFYTFRTGKNYSTCDIYVLLALNDKKDIIKTFIVLSSKVINNII